MMHKKNKSSIIELIKCFISSLQIKKREGTECFDDFNMATYTNRIFGMFDGKTEIVKLECINEYAGVIVDRFGKDVNLIRKDEEHFTVNVDVTISDHFFGWIFALGNGVKIVSPDDVVERMKRIINELEDVYSKVNINDKK